MGEIVRYVLTNVKTSLNLDIKAKNLHLTAYFSCENEFLLGPSNFLIVHCAAAKCSGDRHGHALAQSGNETTIPG